MVVQAAIKPSHTLSLLQGLAASYVRALEIQKSQAAVPKENWTQFLRFAEGALNILAISLAGGGTQNLPSPFNLAYSLVDPISGQAAVWKESLKRSEAWILESIDRAIYKAADHLNCLLRGADETFRDLLPEEGEWFQAVMGSGLRAFLK